MSANKNMETKLKWLQGKNIMVAKCQRGWVINIKRSYYVCDVMMKTIESVCRGWKVGWSWTSLACYFVIKSICIHKFRYLRNMIEQIFPRHKRSSSHLLLFLAWWIQFNIVILFWIFDERRWGELLVFNGEMPYATSLIPWICIDTLRQLQYYYFFLRVAGRSGVLLISTFVTT
jgi:hypothetical protein